VRVLALTPELPYAPGGSGGSTRQFHLLRRLVERGHNVEVIAPIHHTQSHGAELLRAAGVGLRGVDRPRSRIRETLAALRRRPALAAAAWREPILAWQVDVFWTALRDFLDRADRPDVVLVEHDWAAAWHVDIPWSVPKVLVLENVSGGYYRARAAAAAAPVRPALALEARRFDRFDRRHLPGYDLLVAVSEEDAALAKRLVPTPCAIVPNGVDTTLFEPSGSSEERLLLFTGTLGYPPNAEAVLWFLREVWPLLPRDVRLRVVGPDPPAAALRLADERVEFTGRVPDVAPHFGAATVVVVPVLSGGGTRLKVLDALAAGRAVVSTTAGAAGISVRDGEHLLIADGPEEFAAATTRLLDNAGLRESLGRAGRGLVEREYDWRRLGDRLESLLSELVAHT
jgi:glycosyltransferase involved in cell wall biosynthesis